MSTAPLRVAGAPRPWQTRPETPGPLLLALDTGSGVGGVALCRGPVVLGEETWQAGGQQTSQVLPAAARLWERAGVTAQHLQAVAVGTGPGSFSGLRVGLSLGKGFALALGIPLIGVATLDAVAYQHQGAGTTLCAVVGAGRGQYYTALYRRSRGALLRLGEYAVVTADELAERLTTAGRVFVGGELSAELVAFLTRRAGGTLRCASPAAALRRPAYLAELAMGCLSEGPPPDAASLQPIYLQRTR